MLDRLKSFVVKKLRRSGTTIPVVRLHGAIGIATGFRQGLTLASTADALERAFGVKKAPLVAVIVNSPGGSPVQSHLIYRRIRQLAEENEKQVVVYVEDVAASGGYMIACAGDEIVVDASSIVGSIGVVTAGFGFERLIERWGIERRVYTAGARKVTLDPFQPENPEDVEHLKSLQRDVHRHFVDLVKARRGESLSSSEELFDGLFWAGETARALGLVDRVGDMRSDLRARYGEDVSFKLYAPERSFWRRRPAGLGVSMPSGLVSVEEAMAAAEQRALWARYGL